MGKRCFLIGHRDAGRELLPALVEAVELHITQYGVTEFFVGHFGAFDTLAGQAVAQVKTKYPQVGLAMLLPYHPAERPVTLPDGFDGSFYPFEDRTPRRYAIVKANQYMVNHVDFLIAYVWHPASNSRNLVEYAERRGIPVTNLGERRVGE